MIRKEVILTEKRTDAWRWGYHDDKGREFGLLVTTWESDVVEAEPAHPGDGGVTTPAGHYWVAVTQPAKDGKSWGASQSAQYFARREDRDKYLARRLGASLSAAEKKARG